MRGDAGEDTLMLNGSAVELDLRNLPHDTRSAVVDGQSTMASDHALLKVYAGYDNEVGYACRMVDLANIVIKISFVALRPLG